MDDSQQEYDNRRFFGSRVSSRWLGVWTVVSFAPPTSGNSSISRTRRTTGSVKLHRSA